MTGVQTCALPIYHGGAGAGSSPASCTITGYVPSSGHTVLLCEEYSGPMAQGLREGCMRQAMPADGGIQQIQVQYADGPCSRVGLVAGCRVVNGPNTATFWYYQMDGSTQASVSKTCASIGATLVSP